MREQKKDVSFLKKICCYLSTFFISYLVGVFIFLLFFYFYDFDFYFSQSPVWTIFNFIGILGVFTFIGYKSNLKFALLLTGFLFALVIGIVSILPPLIIPDFYQGLRYTEEDGYIIEDEFCRMDCPENYRMIEKGYHIERKYYSWKEAILLDRNVVENNCCQQLNFEFYELFGILIFMELSFKQFPLLFLFAIISSIYMWKSTERNKDSLKLMEDKSHVKNTIIAGITLFSLLAIYNICYMVSHYI
jgi:hypothetical protein